MAIENLNETERSRILKENRGILSRVAEDLGMSPATVSRTFHGITAEKNPVIVKAIEKAIKNGKR